MTVTGACVAVPGVHAPMNNPRNWLLPESVSLLPKMVTLFCTAGRSPLVSVMVPSPLAIVMVLVSAVALA